MKIIMHEDTLAAVHKNSGTTLCNVLVCVYKQPCYLRSEVYIYTYICREKILEHLKYLLKVKTVYAHHLKTWPRTRTSTTTKTRTPEELDDFNTTNIILNISLVVWKLQTKHLNVTVI